MRSCVRKKDSADIPDRIFDLNIWIDKVGRMSLEGRTFDYYKEQAWLGKFWYDYIHNVGFLNFLRFRETNIPTTAKMDEDNKNRLKDRYKR